MSLRILEKTIFWQVSSLVLLVAVLSFGLLSETIFATPRVSAQSQNDSGTLAPTPLAPKSLEDQAEIVKAKQASEAELQDLVKDLKAENEKLDTDIVSLKNLEKEQEAHIKEYTQSLGDLQKLNPTPGPEVVLQIDKLKFDLEEVQKKLVQTKKDLSDREAKFEANLKTIDETQASLESKKQEVKQEVNTLQEQVLSFGSQISLYVALILSYWFIWQILRLLNRRLVKNELFHSIVNLLLNLVLILAIFVTLLIAFIGNLTWLLATLGLLSAALVVALQDFVSSFFAWILIVVTRQYRTGDTISITTGKGIVTGKVYDIGIFRTTFRERFGFNDLLNKELPTGKILSFPNNLILKESVTNFTKEDDIIWHYFGLIITFESDVNKAQEVLSKICKEQFQYALDHEQKFFAGVLNVKQYTPKIYLNIEGSGPQFTIFFATKIGHFRERLEKYSFAILEEFKKNGIELAYNTNRIIFENPNQEDFL